MLDRRDAPTPAEAPPESTAPALCRQWYHAYGRAIYSYLRFHLASADEADDLAAEVFLRALRRFDQFDHSRGSPRAWLFRIAQNAPAGLTTIRHCCQDLDGGGAPDDGVVVSGWPPDRILTAAIYELR
jgi:hypothetical protein